MPAPQATTSSRAARWPCPRTISWRFPRSSTTRSTGPAPCANRTIRADGHRRRRRLRPLPAAQHGGRRERSGAHRRHVSPRGRVRRHAERRLGRGQCRRGGTRRRVRLRGRSRARRTSTSRTRVRTFRSRCIRPCPARRRSSSRRERSSPSARDDASGIRCDEHAARSLGRLSRYCSSPSRGAAGSCSSACRACSLPGALVVPCGFAVVALVAQFAVLTDATAELATPAVIVTAVAGFVVVRPWRGLHVDWWAIASGAGAFAAYAAPIVLSGAATFAGYIKLDDDSTLTALVDRAMEHGRSVDGLEFSTYYRVVDLLLDEGYPLASLLPLGIGHEIVRSDALWLYQPAMAVMAAMLALGLYALAGHVVRGPLAARGRGRRRRAVGAALRVRALGRHQGAGDRVGAARPGRARAAGRQVGSVASADASGRRFGAPARRAERRRARVARSCARRLPRPRRARARPPRGCAADCGLCRLPRGLRAADDRHCPRVPYVEHRQLRPDREPRRAARPDSDGRHLAGGRLPRRSGARRCDEGADPRRRHRRRRRGRGGCCGGKPGRCRSTW